MRTAVSFVLGALAASLVAAAAFRGGGQPLDSTFTYQGQLRNAGQLVNGTADLRFTLWDSDVGGVQIGTANTFNAYPLTDGRFALGLNFGAGAFNGDQRWVQVEFRNPAGVGQYLTLSPRDKINATPYALYALNGVESQWSYNPKTQALSAAQNVAKVGIGTNAPTAALEVVAEGGDDAVKLPTGSIGAEELGAGLLAAGRINTTLVLVPPSTSSSVVRRFDLSAACVLAIQGSARGRGGSSGGAVWIAVNGVVVFSRNWNGFGGVTDFETDVLATVTLAPGTQEIAMHFLASGGTGGVQLPMEFDLLVTTAVAPLEFSVP